MAPGSGNGFWSSGNGNLDGVFYVAPANVQRTAIWASEQPTSDDNDVPAYVSKDNYKTQPAVEKYDDRASDQISGKVWLESNLDGIGTQPTSAGEVFLEDYSVVTSVLTAEGRAAVQKLDDQPAEQRIPALKSLLEAHPEYIAQTVEAKTNADGIYAAKFDAVSYTHLTLPTKA